jgi:hypothetical protein
MSVDREVHQGRPRSDKDCRSQLKKNNNNTRVSRKVKGISRKIFIVNNGLNIVLIP